MRRSAVLVVALTAAIALSPDLRAWGGLGHHVVARIALTRLAPATQQAVTAILGSEDFVLSATWADEVRSARPATYNWHFVDIPYGETKYDAARDCPPTERGDCVIAAIARLRQTLANASADAVERREALKFIIHFVGDLHQPLHSIDLKDRGGNDVRVQTDGPRPSNLHSVWDSGAINRRGLDEDTYLKLLLDDMRARPIPASEARVDVVRWVEDAHKIGVADVYNFPGFVPTGPPASPIALDDAYYKRAQTAIDRQLQLAGVRLAALLNETLGPTR
jgi:hypothetical protein